MKDLLGGTTKEMMEAEMDDHLGYEKSERTNDDSEAHNYRNGYNSKRVNSSYGSMDIDVPQDRNSSFEPKIVRKRQKDISDIDQKFISISPYGRTVSFTRSPQYPYAMKRWYENWDAVSPIFKFSADVRKAFYTTNAIESLNATLRRLNRQRSVFPSAQALLKALYLATFKATRKWTMPIRNWGQILGELAIMYPDRIPE